MTFDEYIWREQFGIYLCTNRGATLMVTFSTVVNEYFWSVTNSHRPNEVGYKSTLKLALLAAETYQSRGVIINDK